MNGPPGTRRHHVLHSDEAALDSLATARGVSANDVVLASVAGALRRWFRRETLAPPPSGLRAFCPVSLRERGERTLGNRIAPWLVPLFVDEPEGEQRLARIHAETSERKRSRAHLGGEGAARLVGRLGAWVGRVGMALAARRRAYNVVVTNVPGPSRPVDFLDARLTGLVPFVPLFPGQRLAVAVVRHAGRLHWGVTEALDRPARGKRLARELARELADLEQAAREAEPLVRDGSA